MFYLNFLNVCLKQNSKLCPTLYRIAFIFINPFFDENLSWRPHIANIAGKVLKSISIIYKASLCLPTGTSTLCTLYYSLVYPCLLYCITVWGSTLKRIVLLCKGWYELYQEVLLTLMLSLYLSSWKFLIYTIYIDFK